MNRRQLWKKAIAWALIGSIANPATMLPAYGRDSDIFLTSVAVGPIAEPNIMLLLDTSDTMNIPEPWREYAGTYDSHTEYLWNDPPFMATISTNAPTPPTLTPAGSWAGATLAERQALRDSANNFAAATETGDPGARSINRNYYDASWFYWLPAGIAETDARLRSHSFNRWRGHVNTIGGARGGITFTATTNYRANNRCRDSGTDPSVDLGLGVFGTGAATAFDPSDPTLPQGLVPSTVFAPTGAVRNSGRYLNQTWHRWERFLDLRNGKFADGDTTYPLTGVGATQLPASPSFFPIATGSGYGTVGANVRGRTEAITPITVASANDFGVSTMVRDAWPFGVTFNNTAVIGDRGQPIRTQKNTSTVATVQGGDSRSGWTTPKADLGGFLYAEIINGTAAGNTIISGTAPYTVAGVLTQVLSTYGIAVGVNNPLSVAWKGNRDATPTFDVTVGTPAYVSFPTTRGSMTAGSNVVTLQVGLGAGGFAVGQFVNVAGAGTGGAPLQARVNAVAADGTTLTLGNTPTGATPANAVLSVANVPITGNLRLQTGGIPALPRCQITYTLDADGTLAGNQAAFAATTNNDGTNVARSWTKSNATCVANVPVPVGPGNDCTGVAQVNKPPQGSGDYITARYQACAWSGRQTNDVEFVGTFHFGGTCGPAAACRGSGFAANASECVAAGSATTTFGTSSFVVDNFCTTTGLQNLTEGVTQMAGAVLNPANPLTTGCTRRADTTRSCPVRETAASQPVACTTGASCAGCVYGRTSCPTDTVTTVPVPTIEEHAAFGNLARDNELVHDCSADNGTPGNPSSSNITNATDRLFNSAYNLTVNAAANTGAAYTTGTAATGPAIDTYSVNYLNFKFGPKGPNGHPIGRKTRLGIAKTALSDLIRTTDGVRFGLTVYNRVAGCVSSAGTIPAGTNALTLSDNPGFAAGGGIRITGAGGGGTDLVTTISTITQNVNDVTLTLAASAATPFSTTGTIAVAATALTVPANPGFAIGDRIRVVGAGALGADLLTTVAAVDTTGPVVITLSSAAETAVTNAVVAPIFDTTVVANPCSGFVTNDGGNIAFAIRPMGVNALDPNFANRALLITAVDRVVAASRTPLTESLYEIYRYFSGRTPQFGTSTAVALAGGTVTQGRDTTAICNAAQVVAGECVAAGAYRSPMMSNPVVGSAAGCQSNFIIAINDGTAEDDWTANTDIKRLSHSGVLGTVSTRTTIDTVNPDTPTDQFETAGVRFGNVDTGSTAFDGGFIWLDELAYFMSRADISPGALNLPGDTGPDRIAGRQSIRTFTIGFAGAASPVLQNAADVSGANGFFVAEDAAALSASLFDAVATIKLFPAVFASPTVPISALNRSQNATDVFIAFFKPDTSSFWVGTVKRFQLSTSETDCGPGIALCMIGQNVLTKDPPNASPVKNIETIQEDPVTKAIDVVVDPNASSFWGPSTLLDAANADQGGTGYQLITTAGLTPATRNVYTFVTGSATSANLTDVSNAMKETNVTLTGTLLGNAAMSASTRATLINFARGGNPGDANCADSDSTTVCAAWRSWPHGAVEHSKPVVVAYDVTSDPPTQTLYYLSSDGLLHAVDANTGKEHWAFLIEEALPQIQAQMTDTVGEEINLADGSLAIYQSDDNADGIVNGADKVWLYFGLRRGGRVYYALDVTTRDAPQFKWKITANSGSGQICSGLGACVANSAYNELGQTWSAPQIGRIRALGLAVPALIFGGGYDTNQDNTPVAVADTVGRAVYVVNGDTAAVVKQFVTEAGVVTGTMSFSIPSDVNALNTDNDATGFLDRIYVGDMGGNVWRFDIDDPNPANWRGKKLADLSGADVPKRKIFFPPTVAKQTVPISFDAVYVGTGDREHPLLLEPATAADKIFMIMDRAQGLTMSGSAAAVFPTNFLSLDNTTTGGIATADLNASGIEGWFRSLDASEKVVGPATVFFQVLRFGTYAPLGITDACTPAGQGRSNEISALTGELFNLNQGDPLLPHDRYDIAALSRGFPSTGQVLIIGNKVFHVVLGNVPQIKEIATIGTSKVYWYMEPE